MKRLKVEGGWLLHGDCLKHMRKMKPQSIDLVLGSPPYESARLYLEDGKDLGIARKTEEWVSWMVEVFEESLRICKGIVAYVVGHGAGARKWSGAPALLCADLIRKGVCLRSPAYFKRNGIMGSGTTDWLRADLEWIVCAANSKDELPWSDNTACGHKPKYGPGGELSYRNKKGMRVNVWGADPSSISRRPDGTKRRPTSKAILGNRKPDGTRDVQNGTTYRNQPPVKANPGNVIDCGAVGGNHMGSRIAHDNEAPYPEKLPDFFVRSFCPPGGIVYDPFGGSGTTAAAAVKTGRRFICSDIRASQIELMRHRVAQAHRRKGLFQ